VRQYLPRQSVNIYRWMRTRCQGSTSCHLVRRERVRDERRERGPRARKTAGRLKDVAKRTHTQHSTRIKMRHRAFIGNCVWGSQDSDQVIRQWKGWRGRGRGRCRGRQQGIRYLHDVRRLCRARRRSMRLKRTRRGLPPRRGYIVRNVRAGQQGLGQVGGRVLHSASEARALFRSQRTPYLIHRGTSYQSFWLI